MTLFYDAEDDAIPVRHFPGVRYPLPRVPIWPVRLIEGPLPGGGKAPFLVMSECTSFPERWAELDEELYLSPLGELDLTEPEAILDFVQRFGWLGWPFEEQIEDPGTDEEIEAEQEYGISFPDKVLPFEDIYLGQQQPKRAFQWRVSEEVERARKRLAFDRRIDSRHEVLLHPDVFALHAKLIRDLTRAWGGISFGHEWWEMLAGWESSEWFDGPVPGDDSPQNIKRAEQFFVEVLNRGLSPFTVEVGLRGGSNEEPRWRANTYEILCLQLANHISQQEVFVHCPVCGKEFVRPKGGSTKRKGRSVGVVYCSPTCGSNARQKKRRKRQREGGSPGNEDQAVEGKEEGHGSKAH